MEKKSVKKNSGKILKGVVVSNKMKDTVVISIDSFKKHPKYGKYIKKQNKIMAHDLGNTCKEGEIIESGTFKELRHLTRTTMTVGSQNPIIGLENLDGVHNLIVEGNNFKFSVDSEKIDSILKYISQFQVNSLISNPPTLEELFIRYYSDEPA